MGDLRRHITEDEGSLQRLAKYIPGFAGYRERQIRRKADQMVREHLCQMLDEIRTELNSIVEGWVHDKPIEFLDDLDRVRGRLQKVRDTIRFADYGYTGWFDAVKIKEEGLDVLYEYDLALRDQIASIAQTVEALARADESDIERHVQQALSAIHQLDKAIRDREQVAMRLVAAE